MDFIEVRDLFPVVNHRVYLNSASTGPLSERSRSAIDAMTALQVDKPYDAERKAQEVTTLRSRVGQLLGADPLTITLTRNTGHGLSLLASGLDWQAGDNVVSVEREFPTNIYPWMALADRQVELRLAPVDDGHAEVAEIFKYCDRRTRVLSISHVQYWNGYRYDLGAISAECRRSNILLCVDAIQSVGAIGIDVVRDGIDFLAAGGYKWLLSPWGTGFAYCTPDLCERLRPPLVGWSSIRDRDDFYHYQFEFGPLAQRFEEGTLNLLGIAGMRASVELMLELGVERIEEHVLDLSSRLGQALDTIGLSVSAPWPRQPGQSSGIISASHPRLEASELSRQLAAAGIVARSHQNLVRFSPHFFNSISEVDKVAEAVGVVAAVR